MSASEARTRTAESETLPSSKFRPRFDPEASVQAKASLDKLLASADVQPAVQVHTTADLCTVYSKQTSAE